MIPAGYMFKKVVRRPDWLKTAGGRILHGRSGVIRAARAHVAWTVDGHKKGGVL